MPELMKGKVWGDRKDALDRKGKPIVEYPVMVEAKHDEIRVHVKVDLGASLNPTVQFLSYAEKPLANLGCYALAFINIAERTGIFEFDMGFEANGNFNDSYRWVRSSNGLPPELLDVPTKWYIFGLPTVQGDLADQHRTRQALAELFVNATGLNVKTPENFWCYSEGDVDATYALFRNKGYEGAMVKQPKHKYERKRTDGWLKMKPENDADGYIVELHEAIAGVDQPELDIRKGDRLGRIGSVTLSIVGDTVNDMSTASPHGIPHELGQDMFHHPEKYIGKWVEFKYMERDRQGGYRHPTFHRLREAKA